MSCITDLDCTSLLMPKKYDCYCLNSPYSNILFIRVERKKANLISCRFIYRLVINLMTINATSCLLLFPAIIYDMQMSALYSNSETLTMLKVNRESHYHDEPFLEDTGLPTNSEVFGYFLKKTNLGMKIILFDLS